MTTTRLSPAAVAALHQQAVETHERISEILALLPDAMNALAMQRQIDELQAFCDHAVEVYPELGPAPRLTPGGQSERVKANRARVEARGADRRSS